MPSPTLKLPAGYRARPATLDDAPVAAELINTCLQVYADQIGSTAEQKRGDWQTPGLNIATDTQLVFKPDGQLVGLLEFWDVQEPHVQVTVNVKAHPDDDFLNIGTYLLAWADRRSQAVLEIAPQGAQVVLIGGADGQDQMTKAILAANGYLEERIFRRMLLEMEQPPLTPNWPEGISWRTHITGQDDYAVYETIERTFVDHWRHVPTAYELWRHWNVEEDEFDPGLWFLALEGSTVVGALMAWPTFHSDPETGMISDLGVKKAWRKRGIGRALLLQAFQAFYERGISKVALIVDTDSQTGAGRLYEGVGMRQVHRRVVYEKELRPAGP